MPPSTAIASPPAAVPAPGSRYATSMFILGVLFFIFGFVTWLNGTLIPFLKLACGLKSDAEALLVTFAFYMAYFCLAIPSSLILKRTGFKKGMALGLAIMAAGALLFIPAANSRSFGLFLTGLFVQGMGLALLQTASNPYISVIGPIESAAQRISIVGICNKTAGALAPLILSAIVLKGADQAQQRIQAAVSAVEREQLLHDLAHRVVGPYLVMAAALALLALMILWSSLPEIDTDGQEAPASAGGARTSIFDFPHLWLGVLCIFLYVGVEVMAGDVIGTFSRSLGLSLDRTKSFTAFTMAAMGLGYIIGIIVIPRWISQQAALRVSALLAIALACGILLAPGTDAIPFVALLGLANAAMWPAIFPLAIRGLGRFTKLGSALLIMGIAGGAVMPQVYAHLTRVISPPEAFFATILPCYLYILFYAARGHRVGLGQTA